MDDFRLDALLIGRALVTVNKDVPGVIGTVGSILGNHGVNIAEWRMARNQPGGIALSFINIDSAAEENVLTELRQLSSMLDVRQVAL